MGVNTISATRKVKTNAVTPDGSFEIRDAKASYSGQIVTARIAAQISAGRKSAAVHNDATTSASASATRAVSRAPE